MDVKQDHTFLSELVRRVRHGSLAPAGFQRPYVWTQNDVEAMFESLIDAFPIGAFLLWEPSAGYDFDRVARHRLGPLPVGSEARYKMALVDGQNRLATLAWAMFDTLPVPEDLSEDERNTWAAGERLVADVRDRKVQFVPADEADDPDNLCIPAGVVCTVGELGRFLIHNTALCDRLMKLPDALDWLDFVTDRIKTARVTTTVISDATPAEAVSAFTRLAKTGVPMAPEDIAAAIGWTPEAR